VELFKRLEVNGGIYLKLKMMMGLKHQNLKKVITIPKKLKSRVLLTTLGLKFPLRRHAEQKSLE